MVRGQVGGSNTRAGLVIPRYFTRHDETPGDHIAWERRRARITNEARAVIFEQGSVEAPQRWSRRAVSVAASRYFAGQPGQPDRERSVRQMIDRVIGTLGRWGEASGSFATSEDRRAFEAEIEHLVLHQMASFSGPIWRNLGTQERPFCSACAINSVRDDMDAIMDLAHTEAQLFKEGAGAGVNLSALRASHEPLSGGGKASGPISFMRGYDAFAGVIKAGGIGRPAANMVQLDIDHPDVLEFIRAKVDEQRKAWSLIDAGYEGSIEGEAFRSVAFQSTTLSVRVTDAFMAAAADQRPWTTRDRHGTASSFDAATLLSEIALAAHECGEPGVQYDTTINTWHTCPSTGRIDASTPCSDFMFLADTACTVATLNLTAFLDQEGDLDITALCRAVDLLVIALDLVIDRAVYPTSEIAHTTKLFRPLGLGYAGLGALLMSCGLPYDSGRGRAVAATVTALITGEAYAQSGRMAERFDSFARFRHNREPLRYVLDRHVEALRAVSRTGVRPELRQAAEQAWQEARLRARTHGLRHAQVTAAAPSGPTALMMDSETGGVEPDIALVTYRRLSGRDEVPVVHRAVPAALAALSYERPRARQIVEHLEEHGTLEDAPGLEPDHLPVFDCARRAAAGRRRVSSEGHLRMAAALQPFFSGAISKTINLDEEASVEDVERIFTSAHQLGLKAIAIHREGSRRHAAIERSQPAEATGERRRPRRRRLPDERQSITHKFSIAGHEGYLTVGLYEDGSPGELFVRMAKAGSVVAGLMDSIALALSLSLQYGVPLQVLVDKYSHSRFEPSGFTTNPDIPIAKSIMDYIFRWLGQKFPGEPEEDSDERGGEDQLVLPGT